MKFQPRLIAGLFLLLIALTLVHSPKPVQANTWTCDLNANMGAEACTNQVITCIFWSGSLCFTQYYYCQNNNKIAHDDCEFASAESPAPWPVIDERLSWCLQGCVECDQIEDAFERLQCSASCKRHCFQIYPKA